MIVKTRIQNPTALMAGSALTAEHAEIAEGFANSERCRRDEALTKVAQPHTVESKGSPASFLRACLPILSIRPKFGSVWKNVR